MLKGLIRPFFAAAMGIALGLVIAAAAGENPLTVLMVMVRSALGSPYDIGMSLFYATPLIFTGLAVALPLHAGLFNIGGEGQMTIGVLAATAVAIMLPGLPAGVAIPLTVVVAFAGGALWGAIPGWMRARRGTHEVIATIMMNFIAAGVASWITMDCLHDTQSMNPETFAVADAYLWAKIPGLGGAPLTAIWLVGVFLALGVAGLLWRTGFGLNLRAVGHSEGAARVAGISLVRTRVAALALGGGLAGLAGIGEVFGAAGRFKLGFSAEYGFMGIAVALLARKHPLGLIPAAVLFGALHKGAGDLDLETEFITRDLATIMQALVVLAIATNLRRGSSCSMNS